MDNYIEKTDKFYSDINIWHWAIFSAGKKSGKDKVAEITIPANDGVHRLIVKYGEQVPAWVELKTFWTIEYIFSKKFPDYTVLKIDAEKQIEKEYEKYMSEHKIKDVELLNEADRQQIIYNAMDNLRTNYRMYIDISLLANLLYPGKRANSVVKKSLEILSDTKIKPGSTFYLGNDFAELKLEDVPMIHYSSAFTKESGRATISLNGIHLYNLFNKRFKAVDLNFINKIKSPIAGLTYKFLAPKIYGSKKYKHVTRNVSYEVLCDFAQITCHSKKSYILRQLTEPMEELKRLHFIMHWSLQKDLTGYSIDFYYDYDFFANFYHAAKPDDKQEVEDTIKNMSPEDIEDITGPFMQSVRETKYVEDPRENEKLRGYYLRYILLNG